MSSYQIANQVMDLSDPETTLRLVEAHSRRDRPLCLCRQPPIEMYIAKRGDKYFVKRMPNTGADHDPACESYEPPAELSGLGEVLGSAIQENVDDGTTVLKLAFSLTRLPGRAPAKGGPPTDSVKTDGTKLTLRGTLHYLYEQAGLNKWTPAMSGKRNWYVIRKYLLQAVEAKLAKGTPLSELVYIPETFSTERQAEIAQRRLAQISTIAGPHKGNKRLMLLIAEVKEIGPARYGHKIVVKHAPDFPFGLTDELHKRLTKRFESELAVWNADEGCHLLIVGTFGVGPTGYGALEELSFVTVTENWIPFETVYDKAVLEKLTLERRSFVRGLRYNLAADRPFACAVASDTRPKPVALYVLPSGASSELAQALSALIEESGLLPWVWDAENDMPPLPERQGYRLIIKMPSSTVNEEPAQEETVCS